MKSLKISDWDKVADWVDGYKIPPSFLNEAVKSQYPKDAFSLGQLASKVWLLEELAESGYHNPGSQWAILGCWIGALVPLLHRQHQIKRIYGFDTDHGAIQLSEQFNRRYVENDWKFKGVTADVSTMDTSNMEFFTSGELIQFTPDVVINTSSEHMSTEWFDTASVHQLIVMQTNNSEYEDGHINTCNSVEDMKYRYPLSRTIYEGEFVLPTYTRYMQIGYK